MPDPILASYSPLACEFPDDERLSNESAARTHSGDRGPPRSDQSWAESDAQASGTVWLCRRVAHLPLAETFQVEHWWLMTANREAGMGACGEGVPGGRSDSPYFTETCVNDHSGEHVHDDARCEPVGNADPACVDRELSVGRALGVWTPTNQCQSFAQGVLDDCTPRETRFEGAEGASSE